MNGPVRPIRVLIVDDSALMRKVLTDLLSGVPAIEVVGAAKDADEAVRRVEALAPDVVTLDVEMPGMSGVDAIPRLLAIRPVPIVMVSSHTREGAEITLACLERGAVDFLPKPERHQLAQLQAARQVLVDKILDAARCRVRPPAGPFPPVTIESAAVARPPTSTSEARASAPTAASRSAAWCLAIGISTGGPQALTRVFSALRRPVPAILVVQHMPAPFTGALAARLDRLCAVPVREAEDGERLVSDRVLIAPGDRHLAVVGRPRQARVSLRDDSPVSGHKPSVDVLFSAVARVFGSASVGVIMTGMGRDGVEGCRQIRQVGGSTFGQDEASSTVYGMNKAAFEDGVLSSQFHIDELPAIIRRLETDRSES